jgi:3-oxoacyl-[acyl-carrier protein] reductase
MRNLIAVVTGGTRGIGLAIAKSLARRGAAVAVTFKNDNKAADEARMQLVDLCGNEKSVLALKGNTANPDIVAEHYKTINSVLGPVNVLVNNAGVMPRRSFDEITIQDWDETIRINLSGSFYWSRLVVPDMKAAKFGRIVNIASIAARGGGVVGPHYAASKAGMVGMTRYAARELGPSGITVNAIAPAFIEDAGIFAEWTEDKKAALREKVVVSQLGNTDDVVRAFEYLLDSPFVTGVTLDVNGGAFMI